MSRSGIVNVRMVITEEKILSNIEKVQKLINPNSKKQIVQLDDDAYFKDLIESIKSYLMEYPKKKNFPISVYKAAYGLVEYATNQFEENTKKIEELIRQREENITLAGELKELVEKVANKEDGWKDALKEAKTNNKFPEDVVETLEILGKCKTKTSENYQNATKLLNARVNNLEANLHIEIDMERIEDRSKALSYIGIEIADALKTIPTPVEDLAESKMKEVEEASISLPLQNDVEIIQNGEDEMENIKVATTTEENAEQQYQEETTFEAKPSLWQRFKNSKFVRAIRFITKARIVIQYPALPDGKEQHS